MSSLPDTQATFRNAIAGGSAAGLLTALRAPADPAERLEIYRRHYRESFRRHLRGRYPTLEWLIGTEPMLALADLTLHRDPPRAPSLAEYGAELIETICTSGGDLPAYAADVAMLDWHLGSVSVAVTHAPLTLDALAAVDPNRLAGLRFALQPGVVFLRLDWPVDDLVHLRLQDSQRAELAFMAQETFLQVRGARGEFMLQKLGVGPFAFRSHLAKGHSLGAAAGAGASAQSDFDLSAALSLIFAEGHVINLIPETSHA